METYYSKEEIIEAGLDEAGRGCLAGPVFAAAVIWPRELDPEIEHQNSMILRNLVRSEENILGIILKKMPIDYAVASCDQHEIDEINILKASHLAMHKAIRKLNIEPELLLVDGNMFTNFFKNDGDIIEHECIIKGDGKFSSISAASILAKTYHDDYIENLLEENPDLDKYGWKTNMCYGTKQHMDAIKKYGTTIHHRKSFKLA